MPVTWLHIDDLLIQWQQENPKRIGSLSYDRYEKYKGSRTVREAKKNGAEACDFNNDHLKGFLRVLPHKKAKVRLNTKSDTSNNQIDASATSTSNRKGAAREKATAALAVERRISSHLRCRAKRRIKETYSSRHRHSRKESQESTSNRIKTTITTQTSEKGQHSAASGKKRKGVAFEELRPLELMLQKASTSSSVTGMSSDVNVDRSHNFVRETIAYLRVSPAVSPPAAPTIAQPPAISQVVLPPPHQHPPTILQQPAIAQVVPPLPPPSTIPQQPLLAQQFLTQQQMHDGRMNLDIEAPRDASINAVSDFEKGSEFNLSHGARTILSDDDGSYPHDPHAASDFDDGSEFNLSHGASTISSDDDCSHAYDLDDAETASSSDANDDNHRAVCGHFQDVEEVDDAEPASNSDSNDDSRRALCGNLQGVEDVEVKHCEMIRPSHVISLCGRQSAPQQDLLCSQLNLYRDKMGALPEGPGEATPKASARGKEEGQAIREGSSESEPGRHELGQRDPCQGGECGSQKDALVLGSSTSDNSKAATPRDECKSPQQGRRSRRSALEFRSHSRLEPRRQDPCCAGEYDSGKNHTLVFESSISEKPSVCTLRGKQETSLSQVALQILPEDAPVGHEAWLRVQYGKALVPLPPGVVQGSTTHTLTRRSAPAASFRLDGRSLRKFYVLESKCGSAELTARVARACFLRYMTGRSLSAVTEYREEIYRKLQPLLPKPWDEKKSFYFGCFKVGYHNHKIWGPRWEVRCPFHRSSIGPCRRFFKVDLQNPEITIRRLKEWCNAATKYDRRRDHARHKFKDESPPMDALDRDCITNAPPLNSVLDDEELDAKGKTKRESDILSDATHDVKKFVCGELLDDGTPCPQVPPPPPPPPPCVANRRRPKRLRPRMNALQHPELCNRWLGISLTDANCARGMGLVRKRKARLWRGARKLLERLKKCHAMPCACPPPAEVPDREQVNAYASVGDELDELDERTEPQKGRMTLPSNGADLCRFFMQQKQSETDDKREKTDGGRLSFIQKDRKITDDDSKKSPLPWICGELLDDGTPCNMRFPTYQALRTHQSITRRHATVPAAPWLKKCHAISACPSSTEVPDQEKLNANAKIGDEPDALAKITDDDSKQISLPWRRPEDADSEENEVVANEEEEVHLYRIPLEMPIAFLEEPWQRRTDFRFGCFTFCYQSGGNDRFRGPFGSWVAHCPFHRLNGKTPCSKVLQIEGPGGLHMESCVRRLKTWCNLAPLYDRQRHHVRHKSEQRLLPMAVLDLECITQAPTYVKTDLELDALGVSMHDE